MRNTTKPVDLRKRTYLIDPTAPKYRMTPQDCMVIFVVLAVLLFSIIAVSAAPSPGMMNWV